MAARKSFLRVIPENGELTCLIDEAVKKGVTDEQLAEQRISFAYGNAPVDSASNKETVREDLKHNKLIYARL